VMKRNKLHGFSSTEKRQFSLKTGRSHPWA
jgi:hypothetical protein